MKQQHDTYVFLSGTIRSCIFAWPPSLFLGLHSHLKTAAKPQVVEQATPLMYTASYASLLYVIFGSGLCHLQKRALSLSARRWGS